MRDGAYAPGAIEIGMMNSAVCQMARFYNVPAGGYLGLTNSKVADAQAGFEKGMSPLMGALSGADFIVMGGLQDALMSFDFGQATIDNEIALMIKRVRQGFGFRRESASLRRLRKPARRACSRPTLRPWNVCLRQPSCPNWPTGSCASIGNWKAARPFISAH